MQLYRGQLECCCTAQATARHKHETNICEWKDSAYSPPRTHADAHAVAWVRFDEQAAFGGHLGIEGDSQGATEPHGHQATSERVLSDKQPSSLSWSNAHAVLQSTLLSIKWYVYLNNMLGKPASDASAKDCSRCHPAPQAPHHECWSAARPQEQLLALISGS